MFTTIATGRLAGIGRAAIEPKPRVWAGIGQLWCRWAHGGVRWPIHDHYLCSTCMRSFPVPWANRERLHRPGPVSETVAAPPSTHCKAA
jgi:hypothetical protein